jgi:2-polyprenyl-3-methyl-5-hydroxy-6-metoxy-1,4-benzoquinol methylase
MNFSNRAYDKELLDRDDIPFHDILQNMKELNTINRLLGGHAITIRGLKTILSVSGSQQNSPIRIAEIGSGGGDNLRVLKSYCTEHSIPAFFTGIDINLHCIESARRHDKGSGIDYIHSDYKTVEFEHKPDIIFSSLFCHHFNELELVSMLKWMYTNSKLGFFINDLQRHRLAYYSISLLTTLFSKSYLVKNDAPLSVRRGFSKEELKTLLQQAGIADGSVIWQWAFRFLVIAIHSGNEYDKL